MTEREQHERIARDFAEQGFLLTYTRAYVGARREARWVPLLHDVEVGNTTRYPRGATKLEAAEGAWKLFHAQSLRLNGRERSSSAPTAPSWSGTSTQQSPPGGGPGSYDLDGPFPPRYWSFGEQPAPGGLP